MPNVAKEYIAEEQGRIAQLKFNLDALAEFVKTIDNGTTPLRSLFPLEEFFHRLLANFETERVRIEQALEGATPFTTLFSSESTMSVDTFNSNRRKIYQAYTDMLHALNTALTAILKGGEVDSENNRKRTIAGMTSLKIGSGGNDVWSHGGSNTVRNIFGLKQRIFSLLDPNKDLFDAIGKLGEYSADRYENAHDYRGWRFGYTRKEKIDAAVDYCDAIIMHAGKFSTSEAAQQALLLPAAPALHQGILGGIVSSIIAVVKSILATITAIVTPIKQRSDSTASTDSVASTSSTASAASSATPATPVRPSASSFSTPATPTRPVRLSSPEVTKRARNVEEVGCDIGALVQSIIGNTTVNFAIADHDHVGTAHKSLMAKSKVARKNNKEELNLVLDSSASVLCLVYAATDQKQDFDAAAKKAMEQICDLKIEMILMKNDTPPQYVVNFMKALKACCMEKYGSDRQAIPGVMWCYTLLLTDNITGAVKTLAGQRNSQTLKNITAIDVFIAAFEREQKAQTSPARQPAAQNDHAARVTRASYQKEPSTPWGKAKQGFHTVASH